MSTLEITGLRAAVGGREILRGVDLVVRSGEVHAVMGPNGAGKSTLAHVLMGHPGYEVLGGSVTLDGLELLGLPTWKRAQAGLFLAPQDPVEVPGVPIRDVLAAALIAGDRPAEADLAALTRRMAAEAAEIGLAPVFLERSLNVDASGGEKKRIETLQLATLAPRFAVLDELDSGLDVDALRAVSRRVERATAGQDEGSPKLGVLAITHYNRLLEVLRPDAVHVLVKGQIVASGGPELADELERTGYAGYVEPEVARVAIGPDPFGGLFS
jgi:Fe-S cluster assembly ATP-binding protein